MEDQKDNDDASMYSKLTIDIQNLYARIGTERDEQLAHTRAGIEADQKKLYEEISVERRNHVEMCEKILRKELDEFSNTIKNNTYALQQTMAETRATLSTAGAVPLPPGLRD